MRDKAQPIDYLMIASSVQDKDLPPYLTRGKKYPVLQTPVAGAYVIADDVQDEITVYPAHNGYLPAGSWDLFYADEAGRISGTLCEKIGYKEGDHFTIRKASKEDRASGAHEVVLVEDDGTNTPLFHFKSGTKAPRHFSIAEVEKVGPTIVKPTTLSLVEAAMHFLELSEFKVGALAEWKPGFRNKIPEGPFIIMDVGLMDRDKESTCDSVYYSEPLDVCVGYLDRPKVSQGATTFLLLHVDSRRLRPVDDDA